MPEDKPIFISDLLAQEEPDPRVAVATIKDYVEHGMTFKPREFQALIEKTRLGGLDLTLLYSRLVKAAGNPEITLKARQGYGDAVMYLQGRIDQVNPRTNGNKALL